MRVLRREGARFSGTKPTCTPRGQKKGVRIPLPGDHEASRADRSLGQSVKLTFGTHQGGFARPRRLDLRSSSGLTPRSAGETIAWPARRQPDSTTRSGVAELSPGMMLTPSLQLLRKLGAGGMGTVWVARHLGLNSDVVVKLITGEAVQNAEVVARFRREAAAAAEVRSPHVVQVFDFGVGSNGQPYMAMELLEGEDLGTRLAREGMLPAAEVAGIVVQVCRALSRAHEKGIVHRDIKPENIFLCETGEDEALVKVLDFGIAKFARSSSYGGTATGAFLGTPYFMSPEQVNDAKTIDHRTDLWSLGVVAYLALTGTRPFDGETLVAVAMKICTGEAPLPSHQRRDLSAEVDAWFVQACAKNPAQRFQSARAMAEALVSAVGGRGMARVASRQAAFENAATQEFRAATFGYQSVPAPPPILLPTQDGTAPMLPAVTPGLATTTGPSVSLAASASPGNAPPAAAPNRPLSKRALLGLGLAAGAVTIVAVLDVHFWPTARTNAGQAVEPITAMPAAEKSSAPASEELPTPPAAPKQSEAAPPSPVSTSTAPESSTTARTALPAPKKPPTESVRPRLAPSTRPSVSASRPPTQPAVPLTATPPDVYKE